jgi:hypothetical protein
MRRTVSKLFRRFWDLRIGGLSIAGEGAGGGAEIASLDLSFETTKSTKPEPNTCGIKIWNLAPEHRRQLEGAQNLALTVDAGYVDLHEIIFSGDVRVASSRRSTSASRRPRKQDGSLAHRAEGVDVVTEIEAEDGGRAWRTATVSWSFARATTVEAVLREALRAMDLGEGNLREIGTIGLAEEVLTYASGTVLSGPAHREVDRIVRSCGLTWSIQNGALQLRRGGAALATTAVRLTPATGLLGSPAPDAENRIECVALLVPGLYPGRPVVLESREVSGSYQVARVRYVGDTAGAEWQSQLVLEPR